MEKEITYLEAKSKLENLCAYQEKCQFDIDQKLRLWGFSEQQRNELIAHLISYNFINEERYASAFVSGKFNIKKWGRIKIKSHLKQKQISNYSIEKGLKEINQTDYWSAIEKLAKKKMNELSLKKDSLWEKKGKVYRYLASKGYETSLINEVINEI